MLSLNTLACMPLIKLQYLFIFNFLGNFYVQRNMEILSVYFCVLTNARTCLTQILVRISNMTITPGNQFPLALL